MLFFITEEKKKKKQKQKDDQPRKEVLRNTFTQSVKIKHFQKSYLEVSSEIKGLSHQADCQDRSLAVQCNALPSTTTY